MSIREPAAGRVLAGSGGPQRPQVWALGRRVAVRHLEASPQGWETPQPGVLARARGRPQAGGGEWDRPVPPPGAPSLLREPQLSFENLLWGGREVGTFG